LYKLVVKNKLTNIAIEPEIKPAPVPKAKTRRRRLSPNTIQNRETIKQSRKEK
jgi:hypothetical protein